MPEWLVTYKKQDRSVSCLFGEHRLRKYPLNPIALVEAPKTAIYGMLYFGFPENPNSLIWLAVYNKSSFTFDKLKVLQGRRVFVFPDLSKNGGTFQEWELKAKKYERRLTRTRFVFSDLLEKYATPKQRQDGGDIADILINLDWQRFRKQNPQGLEQSIAIDASTDCGTTSTVCGTKEYKSNPTLEEAGDDKEPSAAVVGILSAKSGQSDPPIPLIASNPNRHRLLHATT